MRGHPKTELERAQRKAEADPATWDEANELDADTDPIVAIIEEQVAAVTARKPAAPAPWLSQMSSS